MLLPLAKDLNQTALAFRGYNVTNIGRTDELLANAVYSDIVAHELDRFGAVCTKITGRSADLVARVRERREPTLETYAESIALIVAAEVAQLRLLQEVHEVDTTRAPLSFGYSLGELVAVSCAGVFAPDHMIRVPLAMAEDSVSLAHDVTMGVLFSRGPAINEGSVFRLCDEVTSEGQGTIGVSSVLSPNTYLLLGQRETIERFRAVMKTSLPHRAQIRINENRWPPLHTPIARQRQIPDRASVLMETLPGGYGTATNNVFSLVTGKLSYRSAAARPILRDWIDHPQRLWDAIDFCLAKGVETVVHVGPDPNLIPATFARLSENIREQTSRTSLASYGMRAVSGMARRSWLLGLLPGRANLLRAPFVKHIVLEDWLLQNAPK